MKVFRLLSLLVAFAFLGTVSLFAQSPATSWEQAQDQMMESFGIVPEFFYSVPEPLRVETWNQMMAYSSDELETSAKTRELIGLAVASQIPCDYCVYAHTEQAKALGATEQELREAVAQAAFVRQWSTYLNGADFDLETFRGQWSTMVDQATASK